MLAALLTLAVVATQFIGAENGYPQDELNPQTGHVGFGQEGPRIFYPPRQFRFTPPADPQGADPEEKATDELPEDDDSKGVVESAREMMNNGYKTVNSFISKVFNGTAAAVGGIAGMAKDMADGFMETTSAAYDSMTGETKAEKEQGKGSKGTPEK